MSRPALELLLSALLVLLSLGGCSSGDDSALDASELESSAQALQGTVHELTFNTAATFAIEPGDIIRFKDFPTGWAYSSVEVNFDAISVPLSLVVSENASRYTLSGWNEKIVVPYRRTSTQDLVVESGSGNARIVWWVSSAATTAADPPQEPEPPGEGPVLRDLGAMNTALTVDGSGGLFSINGFPSWSYNVVALMVEPRDGQPLAGELNAGGVKTALSGWSQKVLFKEHSSAAIEFELEFSAPRKVALTWFVEDRVPASRAIARSTSVSGTSVTATYGFAAEHAVQNDLSLTFDSGDFSDGQVPAMTRLEHNPQGVRFPALPEDLNGPTYDINAKLKAGKRVQVALPIPEIALIRGIDENAISVMHYNGATKTWNEIIPDRVSDGYIYFTTDSFSSFYSRMKRKAKKAAAQVGIAVVGVVVVATVATSLVVDKLADVVKETYKLLVSKACSLLDFDTYKRLFFDQPSFKAPRPDLTPIRTSPDFDASALRAVMGTGLQLLSQAPPYPPEKPVHNGADYEAGRWLAATANAKVLLADVLLNEAEAARRFEVSGSGSSAVVYDRVAKRSYRSSEIFLFTSRLLASAPRVLGLVRECDGALGLGDEFSQTLGHVTDFVKAATRLDLGDACRESLLLPAEIVDWAVPDFASCVSEATTFGVYYLEKSLDQYWGPGRDAHIIHPSELLSVLATAVWAEPKLKDALGDGTSQLRDQIHSYVGLTHDMYGENNIMIKAMVGVALWDMITKGDKASYGTMKAWLEAKTGDQGGYAEGAGYLQYINDDVPYLLSAMVRGGFITRSELPQKYLRSGEWLLNASHRRGAGGEGFERAPVESDDGKTHTPDYLVYSYLTGDGRYRQFGTRHRLLNVLPLPLGAVGLPSVTLPVSAPVVLPDVYFADGVGVVRANGSAATATLSVIAESGNLRTGGMGHDQQDNGSVSLSHSSYDMIIRDTGYNGFGARNDNLFARFDNHNVVMTAEAGDYHGEKGNGKITWGDAAHALAQQPGVYNLDWLSGAPAFHAVGSNVFSYMLGRPFTAGLSWSAVSGAWLTFQDQPAPGEIDGHAGGADANLLGPLVNDLPLHASHGLEVKHTSTANVTDRRFLLSFANHVWIIDRPENKRALWSRLHFDLGQQDKAFQVPQTTAVDVELRDIPQHGAPKLNLLQRTLVGGSADETPVFVTALRISATTKPDIVEVGCAGAVCLSNVGFDGARDLVIVPRWNEQYVDHAFFQGLVRTGQILLAHRDAGDNVWTFRLVGDESPALAPTSLSALTGHVRDVVYRLRNDGYFTAHLPDGSTQVLQGGGT